MSILSGMLAGLIILVLLAFIILCIIVSSKRLPVTPKPGAIKRLSQYLGQAVVETEVNPDLPELKTPTYEINPDILYDYCCLACRRLGWDIRRQSSETLTVEAVCHNRLARSEDVIVIKCAQFGRYAILNARSGCTNRLANFGTNVRHIMDLRERVDSLIRTQGSSA